MSGSPESGTPIDSLESGNVPNAADASRMAQILQDMNASGAEVASGSGSAPPPQMMQQMPQMQQQMMPQMQPMQQMQMGQLPMPMGGMNGQMPMMVQQQQPNFVPYDDESSGSRNGPKKNMWSNLLDNLFDPLVVAILVFTLSLPVLQTFLSKYATWAFSLGGQLSWLGLIAKSVLAGVLFALYKMGAAALGL